MKKKNRIMMLTCISTLLLTSCGGGAQNTQDAGEVVLVTQGNGQEVLTLQDVTNNDLTEEELTTEWDASAAEHIELSDAGITYSGSNAVVDGSVITIQKAGIYELVGTIKEGQVVVDAQDEGTVQLVLNGVDITSEKSAPIYVKNATKTIVTLASEQGNTLRDGKDSVIDGVDKELQAVVYSETPLTFNGLGALMVEANTANGIACSDDLKFGSGAITVNSVKNAIESSKYVSVKNGSYVLTAGEKGIIAGLSEAGTADDSYVAFEGGSFTLTSQDDAIATSGSIYILNGMYQIMTGQGEKTEEASRGLFGKKNVTVYGGAVNLNTSDNGIASDDMVEIKSGNINLESADDAIHSNNAINVSGGSVVISKCYEGLTASDINLSGGYINVISTEDAINLCGGADGSALENRLGKDEFTKTEQGELIINDCYVNVESDGDGIDANGNVTINGGNVIISGPIDGTHMSVNSTGNYVVNGGIVIASDMADKVTQPSNDSSQNSIVVNFSNTQEPSQVFYVEDNSGNSVVSFSGKKNYKNLIVSKPEIELQKSYSAFGGTVTSNETGDSEIVSDNYTKGDKILDFTATDKVTTINN